MMQRVQFRLYLALGNVPGWLAAAFLIAASLFVNSALSWRELSRDEAAQETLQSLATRAAAVVRVIERSGAEDRDGLNAWFQRARESSGGGITWIRLLDSSGTVEARTGVATANIQWATDARLQAGHSSFRVVQTQAGRVAVTAAPVRIAWPQRHTLIMKASLDTPIPTAVLEVGAVIGPANVGDKFLPRNLLMELIGCGALSVILGASIVKRLLNLD